MYLVVWDLFTKNVSLRLTVCVSWDGFRGLEPLQGEVRRSQKTYSKGEVSPNRRNKQTNTGLILCQGTLVLFLLLLLVLPVRRLLKEEKNFELFL